MKINLILLIVFCLSLFALGQTDTIVFKKKSDKNKVFVPLPHDFDITTTKNEYKFGKAFSQTDSTISLTYHEMDSTKWAAIVKNSTFSRKTKKQKLDSLFKSDSIIYNINKSDISLIKFGVFKTRPRKYQVAFWTSMTLFVATGGLFLSSAVGPHEPNASIRVLKVIPYPLTFGIMMYTAKKRIRKDKWEIK